MTDQHILEQAIQKAIDGGWKVKWIAKDAFRVWSHQKDWLDDGTVNMEITCNDYEMSKPKQFIFNHDFAKALWGKRGEAKMHYTYPMSWHLFKDDELTPTTALLTEWQYHLSKMVIADDPIKYLGDNT